jgi:hypothetical protein
MELSSPDPCELNQISTRWSIVHEPVDFVARYAAAIQRYLRALIHDPHDAEEVAQDFLLRVVQYGFPRVRRDGGRFRDYLKTAVRNAALNFLQRRPAARPEATDLAQLPAPTDSTHAADQAWTREWRACLLKRALAALEAHEQRSPGNLFYTVLQVAVAHPREDSQALAARTAARTGCPLRAEAFRKQLSRARRRLAQLLAMEVAQTLDDPTPARVEEELAALGLMRHVRGLLPAGWQPRSSGADPD